MAIDKVLELAAIRERRGGAAPPDGGGEEDARPVVRITAGDEHVAVNEAEAAILAQGGLYAHGGALVEPREEVIPVSGKERDVSIRLSRLSSTAILERMGRAAKFEKWDSRSEAWSRRAPPKGLAEMLLSRDGNWAAPVLSGIVAAPTLRHDGTLVDQPGYDAATGLLFISRGVEFPAIDPKPSEGAARAALAEVKAIISSFPLVGRASLSVALSCLLTGMVRRSLAAVPVHAFTSPSAGAGKGRLVDVCSIVATGNRAAVTSGGSDKGGDVELEKRLGASLIGGDQFIAIDNVDHPVGGELLCSLITQPTVKLRLLGASQNVVVATGCMVTVTGNNMQIAGDMNRRVVQAVIDPGVERPELLVFERDVLADARRDRPKLAAAALTILLGWLATGKETTGRVLGSFEEWSRLVGGALTWLGEPDPVDAIEDVRETDPKLARLRDMVRAWEAHFAGEAVPVRRVAEACEARRSVEIEGPADPDGRRATRLEWANPELREAVVSITTDKGTAPINIDRLSWWLRKNAGKLVEGRKFTQERGDTARAVTVWRLEGAESPSEDIPL